MTARATAKRGICSDNLTTRPTRTLAGLYLGGGDRFAGLPPGGQEGNRSRTRPPAACCPRPPSRDVAPEPTGFSCPWSFVFITTTIGFDQFHVRKGQFGGTASLFYSSFHLSGSLIILEFCYIILVVTAVLASMCCRFYMYHQPTYAHFYFCNVADTNTIRHITT